MTIARRRSLLIAPAPAQTPPGPLPMLPASGASPVPLPDQPAPDGITLPVGRLRRCTFRRIDRVANPPPRDDGFEAMCLYVDDERPLSLGSIDEARPICDACQATGIFRADED